MIDHFISFISTNWKWIISSLLIVTGLIFSFYYKYKDNRKNNKSTKSEIWPFVIAVLGVVFGAIVSYKNSTENTKAKIEADILKQETKKFQTHTDSLVLRIDSLTNRNDSVTNKNTELSEDIIDIAKDQLSKTKNTLTLQNLLINSQKDLIAVQNNSLAELKGSIDTPHLFINSFQAKDHNELMLRISNYDSITLRNVIVKYTDQPLLSYLIYHNDRPDLSPNATMQRKFTIGAKDYDTMMIKMDYKKLKKKKLEIIILV